MAELIFGNRDGVKRRNESYNVCRFHVPEELFEEEKRAGFHARALDEMHALSCCPALGQADPPAETPLTDQRANRFRGRPGEFIELVYPENRGSNGRQLTICRLGVSRRRMAEEVAAGLHPRYKVARVGPPSSSDRFGKAYVQGKANKTAQDNVNRVGRPWPCGGMCPVSKVTAC